MLGFIEHGLSEETYIAPLAIGSGSDIHPDDPPDFANPAWSAYQREILKLRWEFAVLQTRALHSALTAQEESERSGLLGRLYLRDPYWRLYNDVVQSLAALEPHEKERQRSLLAAMVALSDIRSMISWARRLPVSKEQADAEVAQLRVYVVMRDGAAVQKLLTTKSQ